MSARKKKNYVEKQHDSIYGIIPLFFIVGIIPLVIYIKVITVSDVEVLYTGSRNPRTDIFSYYKMAFLLAASLAGLVTYLLTRSVSPFDEQRKKYYIPAAIYSLFVIISTLASEYKTIASRGFNERYEGVFVLIAYVVVLFLAMNALKEERSIKLLFTCLLGSSFIIALLGALQYFGIDYFKSEFISNLITPALLKNDGGAINSKFPSKTIFTTLYNPNYVGSYMAMLMPIIFIFILWVKETRYKIILALLLCLNAINWIGCDSRAGIVGGIFSFIIIAIVYRKKILQHKKVVLCVMALLCGGLVVLNFAMDGYVVNRISQMISIRGKGADNSTKAALNKSLEGLVDVTLNDERAKIVTEDATLQIIASGTKINLVDEDNKKVDNSVMDSVISLTDPRFQNIKLATKPKEGLIQINFNDYHLFDIVFTKEGLRSTSNIWMTFRGDRAVESFGPAEVEAFGSNRGYIWSRTIPLLKNTILWGNGPDTFALYFPQYDFIGKLKNYVNGGMFVDKPHNMYLQTAINTGVISLIALLVLFGMYFVSSIKIYLKEEFKTFLPVAGLACFAAFCGYAVAGLFNDSVVSVAPVFWTLLGLGIGINVNLKVKLPVSEKATLQGKTARKRG